MYSAAETETRSSFAASQGVFFSSSLVMGCRDCYAVTVFVSASIGSLICSSMNLLLFMSVILLKYGLHDLHVGTAGRGQVMYT